MTSPTKLKRRAEPQVDTSSGWLYTERCLSKGLSSKTCWHVYAFLPGGYGVDDSGSCFQSIPECVMIKEGTDWTLYHRHRIMGLSY